MVTMRRCVVVAVLVIAGLPGAQLWAQRAAACTSGSIQLIGHGLEPRRDVPFTAVVKMTFDQALADGNAIHTVSHSRQARDSNGRTMSEMAMGCAPGADGQLRPSFHVSVNDPAAKTDSNWDENGFGPKIVRVFHREEPASRSLTPAQQAVVLAQRKSAESQPGKVSSAENLGSKTINGVAAEGTRITQTIPAGEEGNTLPLAVVHEEWRSSELGLLLLVIDDDPRHGKTTFEYEELNLGEPDAALFVPPAEYKVEEIHPTIAAQ
jgi:hypothetical protein